MPPSERTSPKLDGAEDHATVTPDATTRDDVLSLAEEAEAEAAEAEAIAAAARARARALRLRREAKAAAAVAPAEPSAPVDDVTDTELVDEDVPTDTELSDTDLSADDPDVTAVAPVPTAVVDEAADGPDGRRRGRFSAPRVSLRVAIGAVAIVLTVGFVVSSGYMIWHHRQVVAEQQRSAEFVAAARQGVVTLMSLDFTRAEEDVQRILDNTTGAFREEFAGQAESFTDVAQQSKVVTEATVNAVAVRSMTQDTANVLVAVTTRVSNAAANEQPPRSWRLSVDVARDGGQIKLAKVEFVP